MGFDNLLFRLASWIRETTSYISPIINEIDDPSCDIEAGQRPGINDHVSSANCPEQVPLDMGDENESEVPNDNDYEPSVTLPRKNKLYFYLFYVSFLVSYAVLVLVTACKYPLKPEYYIHSPAFAKESVNISEEMKQAISLNLTFTNRNKLASVSYDDFNVTMVYTGPRLATGMIYVASNIDQGYKPKPNQVNFHMSAPWLPGLLEQQKRLNKSMHFLVKLTFKVRFRCGFLCRHEHYFQAIRDIEATYV